MTTAAGLIARLREWLSRLAGTFRGGRSDRDLARELQAHLELMNEAGPPEGGHDGAGAHYDVRGFHGHGAALAMDRLRDQRGLPWIEDLGRDLRHGLRLLRRDPVFAAVAILSLALGFGTNSAMFSLADAALLRPLPVHDPGSVVAISAPRPDERRGAPGLSYPNYRDLRERTRSFDGVVAHQRVTVGFARALDAAREMRLALLVSDNFFDVLGVGATAGRTFRRDEGDVPGRDAVVVLGYDFWTHVLGQDPAIVNTVVSINGIDFTVVGVTPESFTGMDAYVRPALYVPTAMAGRLAGAGEDPLEDRSSTAFVVHGRLTPGVSKAAARAELASIWGDLERAYPQANRNRALAVRTELESRMQSDPMTAIAMETLIALVAVVLVIACANVANLLLGRARTRAREVAIRLALGVSRSRLTRQLLAESGLLAIAGCVAGLAVAYASIRLFQTFQVPGDMPIVIAPRLDGRVLAFSLVVAAIAALVFGLVPARQSVRERVVPALKGSEPSRTRGLRPIGRSALVVIQVALSMVLLVVTGMLLDGFRAALLADPGFRTDRLMTLSLDTSFARYTPAQTRAFYGELKARALTLPGVVSAALTSGLPLDRGGTIERVVPDSPAFADGRRGASVFTAVVDEGYFETMDTAIVQGRAFEPADHDRARRVAIVNDRFAALYWPGQQAVGKRLSVGDGRGSWIEIVGVAKTGKYLFISETPMPFLYLPFAQNARTAMSLVVETASEDAGALAGPLRDIVRGLDVNQPIFNVRPFASFYQLRAVAVPRSIVRMVGTMGAIGLTLALIGLYAVVAYSVARRTREIGIRLAVGATRSDVMRMVLRQGLQLASVGIVLGALASTAAARALPAVLVGAGRTNPAIFLLVPAGLVGLTLLASYLPARRASHVDPLLALRDD